jgi:hypothetical protein
MKEISLENFGDALSSLSSAAASVQNGIAHALAKEIQERAKGKIGEYQPASHGFDAWASPAQSTMDQRVSAGYPANNPLLRSGELRDSSTCGWMEMRQL